MFPYLDLAGLKARSSTPSADVDGVEIVQPGFTAQRIAYWSSWVNARLRKRYGNAGASANALPLGQQPPALLAAGTAPPAVTLSGRPTLGSVQVQLAITTAGPVGTAAFKWSVDAGQTWTTGVTTATAVPLAYGLTANFPPGPYSADNVYAASPPVPETVLGWIVTLVTVDLYDKRGNNPSDPAMVRLVDRAAEVRAEVKEAADSREALFDLPASEDAESAVTTSGPLSYTEASPFVSADRQELEAQCEDRRGFGTYGGKGTPWGT